MVLARQPACACGCGRASTDVDHIDGDNMNNSMDNLQGLAHECHSRKTARENRGEMNSNKLYGGCDADGIPTDKAHHWNR